MHRILPDVHRCLAGRIRAQRTWHRPLCAWVQLILVSCSLETELHETWAAARLPFRIGHRHLSPGCLADAYLAATACRATPPTCPWRDVAEKDVQCNMTTEVLDCLDRLFTVRHRAAHGALVVHRRQARTISIRKMDMENGTMARAQTKKMLEVPYQTASAAAASSSSYSGLGLAGFRTASSCSQGSHLLASLRRGAFGR